MRFSCPFCYYAMNVDDSACGYRISCSSCGKSILVPMSHFEEGCIIGDFIIRSKLGEGSIGAVYRATQISLDRQVALKVLFTKYITARGTSDFLREARAAAKLSHTNLVQSYAVGEDNGIYYMAMTYIKGETLKARLLREGRIPIDEALHIAQQVAEALYYAWDESRLIHRDVKPDNIMLTDDGLVKLTDLGLAMNQSEWTEDMDISGSPSYMSPEQYEGNKLDSRSDIYSLGITLYQMLSGKLPFCGETVKELARQHFEEYAVPLNKLDPNIPQKVSQLVKKMMAKYPDERHKDMEDLLNDIWVIRQKTAPNKSLVPDVHTISIKRLDYDIQHESMEEKRRVQKIESNIKHRYDYMKILAFLIPLLVIAAIVGSVLVSSTSKEETEADQQLRQKVSQFERFANDKALDLSTVLKEGNAILKTSKSTVASPIQQSLLTKTELIMAQIQLKHQMEQNVELTNALSAEKAATEALKKEMDQQAKAQSDGLEQRLKDANDHIKKIQTELLPKEESVKLRQEIEQVKTALGKSEKVTEELLRKNSEQTKELHEIRVSELRSKLSELIRTHRFNVVDAIIASEVVKNPEMKPMLSAYETENNFCRKLYYALTESGSQYSLGIFEKSNHVVMISGGMIAYKDSRGRIIQKPWKDLSTDGLVEILNRNPKEFLGNEAELKSAIEYLKGNLGLSLKYLPSHDEHHAIQQMLYNNALEEIAIALPADKKYAELLAQRFLKIISGSPEQETMRKGIRQALNQKDTED